MGDDKNKDAIPQHITGERSKAPTEYTLDLEDVGTADEDFANADTDEMTPAAPSSSRPTVTFRLLNIASNFAPCFFCGEDACDMTFVAKSRLPRKTKAYAVHAECVFDHEELQVVGSGGL
jgi:hypothetical protein